MIDEIRRHGYRFIIGWLLILLLECCLTYFAGRNFDSFLIFFYCPASILVLFCAMKWFFGWLENSTKKSVDDFFKSGKHLEGYLREMDRKQGLICVPKYDFEDEMFAPIHERLTSKGYVMIEQDVNSKYVIYLLKEA